MIIALIKTPPKTPPKETSGFLFSQMSRSSRLICHEDTPQLLDLFKQIKVAQVAAKQSIYRQLLTSDKHTVFEKISIAKAAANRAISDHSTVDNSEALLMEIKDRLGVNNFTIFRGECQLTDSLVQQCFDRFHHRLWTTITPKDEQSFVHEQLSSTTTQPSQEDHPISDTMSWAENFFNSLEKELDLPKSTKAKKRRSEDALLVSPGKHKKLRIKSPVPVASSAPSRSQEATSSNETIHTQVAIAFTQDLSKNPNLIEKKQDVPSVVNLVNEEPLSDITCRGLETSIMPCPQNLGRIFAAFDDRKANDSAVTDLSDSIVGQKLTSISEEESEEGCVMSV